MVERREVDRLHIPQSHRDKVIEGVTNGICSCLATSAT